MSDEDKQRSMGRKRLEVKPIALESGFTQKAIFVDGEHFDWEVDEASYREAERMGPKFQAAVRADIERHFLDSLSEFVGKEMTAAGFNEALRTGWV